MMDKNTTIGIAVFMVVALAAELGSQAIKAFAPAPCECKCEQCTCPRK